MLKPQFHKISRCLPLYPFPSRHSKDSPPVWSFQLCRRWPSECDMKWKLFYNDNNLSWLNCEDECSLGLNTGRFWHEQSVLTGDVMTLMVGLHPDSVDDKPVLAWLATAVLAKVFTEPVIICADHLFYLSSQQASTFTSFTLKLIQTFLALRNT